jgi:phospholipase/carboxylesterase
MPAMSEPLLPTIEIITREPVQASVIWLHGLGADGNDFAGIVPELALPAALGVRFVFPHAPLRPVTINGGYVMRAWYNIATLDLSQAQDADGIHASAQALAALITHEQSRGVPASRIVLGGFSQGGAIALQTGLRFPQRLAGIMALSTYLPLAETLAEEAHSANAKLPVFIGHGRDDNVVPLSLAESTRDILAAKNYAVSWHDYPMAHSVCLPELRAIGAWLAARAGHGEEDGRV